MEVFTSNDAENETVKPWRIVTNNPIDEKPLESEMQPNLASDIEPPPPAATGQKPILRHL
jgi:hypothetical protein